jgi:hypothetical protein
MRYKRKKKERKKEKTRERNEEINWIAFIHYVTVARSISA